MVYCDKNENILEWGSEEIALPYRSPIDNRVHKYYPDFYCQLNPLPSQLLDFPSTILTMWRDGKVE